MTLHDPEKLTAHALGLLDDTEADAVEGHLRVCADCRHEWDDVRETTALLETVPPETLVDDPPAGDLALRRALRRVRDEAGHMPGDMAGDTAGDETGVVAGDGPRHRRRQPRFGRAVAAAAAAVALLAGGAAVGRITAPQPETSTIAGAGSRTVEGAQGPVRMSATLTPAEGWVRLAATVQGIAPGQRCTLLVTGRDGTSAVAGSWVTSPPREPGRPTPIAGSAIIDPAQVRSVSVRNDAGDTLVELPVPAAS
ncbi:MAG: zf-HC2 domain-containing protein [Pseudonocardia sp.]|nr:zf-HC2 domain-containing protein [Pseudonocardia sp.]